jgi:CheY-like chemotaxis protein
MPTVLVIEDDPDMRVLLRVMISRLQYTPLEAADGIQGKALAMHTHPHVVLIDVLMSGIDGYETCRQLREVGYEGKIILMSAYVDPDMAEMARLAGGNEIAAKPLTLAALKQHLHNVFTLQSI